MMRALTARDISAALGGVLPLGAQGVQQPGILGLDRDVHRSRRKVVGAYGMAAQHSGIPNRHIVLEVAPTPLDVTQRPASVPLDEQCSLGYVLRSTSR